MKKYYPLILVEGYLIATLILLFLGPIEFRIHNPFLFSILMVSYHGCFILGYLICAFSYRRPSRLGIDSASDRYSPAVFYVSLVIAVIGVLGTYSNLMLTDSIIPYDFAKNLMRGLSEPGLVYAERMASIESGVTSDSRLFNVLSIFFAFFKLLFIFQFVYFWQVIGNGQKLLSIIYSILFVSSGISSGTNSVVFIFFIFLTLSILVTLYVRKYKHFKKILLASGLAVLLPLSSFGYIMSQRGGDFDYFAGTSPLGDISISTTFVGLDNSTFLEFFYYSFVWLTYYLVQGYYGFSLILNLDFNWTYGFGNSAFLQRQFELLTNIDISPLTFQHRISDVWDESAQWHSFYSQFANDFSLAGLAGLFLVLGYFLSRVWCSVLYRNSFYGAALMPIFALMFAFIPANNQVFGYIDTLSYTVFVSILWALERTPHATTIQNTSDV